MYVVGMQNPRTDAHLDSNLSISISISIPIHGHASEHPHLKPYPIQVHMQRPYAGCLSVSAEEEATDGGADTPPRSLDDEREREYEGRAHIHARLRV
jgi:hypothetical protein